MELKSNDTYRVIFQTGLSNDKLNAFMILYQPLVGGDGILVYLTLLAEAGRNRTQNEHRRLFTLMENITAETFERARRRLEAFMLVKTYVKHTSGHDTYLYILNNPLGANEFFSNGYLSDHYREAVGDRQFSLSKNLLTVSDILTEGYSDVSAPVRNMKNRSFDNETEYVTVRPRYQFRGEDADQIQFDYERFLVLTSNLVFPPELRSQENMYLIGKYATLYGITPERMCLFTEKCADPFEMKFDTKQLELLCRKEKDEKKVEVTDRYQQSPLSFLQSLQNGAAVSVPERQMLEYLSKDMHFSNEVINVMIEYVLKVSDNRLNPKYVGLISGTWARDGVDTKEKAIAETKKKNPWSVKSSSKPPVRKVEMPAYWNEKKEEETMSDEEMAELLRLQKEMSK